MDSLGGEVIEELQQQDGFPFEQVIDWDSAIVTQRLDVIIENEIQNVMVDPNVHCNQGTSQNVPENFAQNGRQIEIELQNAGLEVQIPKVNLEFDEECNWFEKTCTGKNTAIYQVKRADRNEYLKIKVLPADYDGLLFFGLVHNHPNLYTRTIVNKLSSLSVENDPEKLTAFRIWNENDPNKSRVLYVKLKCSKTYETIMGAIVERKPGEDICIQFNTEGSHECNVGNKAANRLWKLIAAPQVKCDQWMTTYKYCATCPFIPYDLEHMDIGYLPIPIQVVAEIRDKKKLSKRGREVGLLYDSFSQEKKRKIDDICNAE